MQSATACQRDESTDERLIRPPVAVTIAVESDAQETNRLGIKPVALQVGREIFCRKGKLADGELTRKECGGFISEELKTTSMACLHPRDPPNSLPVLADHVGLLPSAIHRTSAQALPSSGTAGTISAGC
jgi:hypothetical protein